jgi:hypothetical protein
MSPSPHWTLLGVAWRVGLGCSQGVGERVGAQRLFGPDPSALNWTSAPALELRRAALLGQVCGPSPKPGTPWPTHGVEPPLGLGRDEGTDMFRGRSGPNSRFSALARAMATEPPYVCGADTGCLGLLREITSAPVARDR